MLVQFILLVFIDLPLLLMCFGLLLTVWRLFVIRAIRLRDDDDVSMRRLIFQQFCLSLLDVPVAVMLLIVSLSWHSLGVWRRIRATPLAQLGHQLRSIVFGAFLQLLFDTPFVLAGIGLCVTPRLDTLFALVYHRHVQWKNGVIQAALLLAQDLVAVAELSVLTIVFPLRALLCLLALSKRALIVNGQRIHWHLLVRQHTRRLPHDFLVTFKLAIIFTR